MGSPAAEYDLYVGSRYVGLVTGEAICGDNTKVNVASAA